MVVAEKPLRQGNGTLAPAFPTWPESPLEEVTVLCEGPSALEHQASLLAHSRGPVVAINRAIQFSDVIPIDFWATTDDPQLLWHDYQECLHPETRLFSTRNNLLAWQPLLPDLSRLYHWHSTYMDGLFDLGEDELAPLIPTLFPVLAWCLRQGTKALHLLGADMIGSGTPGIDYQPEADLGHRMRWDVERRMLALSMRQYRSKGSRVSRWMQSRPRSRT